MFTSEAQQTAIYLRFHAEQRQPPRLLSVDINFQTWSICCRTALFMRGTRCCFASYCLETMFSSG